MNEHMRKMAVRFFEGTISAEEEQKLFQFLTADAMHFTQFKAWEEQWKKEHIPPLHVLDSLNLLKSKMQRRRRGIRRWLQISAAAAVLAICSVLSLHLFTHRNAVQLFTVEAPQGTHSRISLPDGTQVWLNAGSTLSYESNFNSDSRDITLAGEAYFEVARNERLPFCVRARGCTFTVLGTKFNISAYDEDPNLMAALMEGSLRFESVQSQETMIPGDLVTYDYNTKTVRREQVNTGQFRGWIDGIIRYDAITLPALLRRLAREYDVQIELRTADFDNTTFRISLTGAQNIHSVMHALRDILPISIERDGRNYRVDSSAKHP